jgi:hypothetical protein
MKLLQILLIGAGAYAAWHFILKDMVIFGVEGLSASNPDPEPEKEDISGQAVGQTGGAYAATDAFTVRSIGQNYDGRSFGL